MADLVKRFWLPITVSSVVAVLLLVCIAILLSQVGSTEGLGQQLFARTPSAPATLVYIVPVVATFTPTPTLTPVPLPTNTPLPPTRTSRAERHKAYRPRHRSGGSRPRPGR